MFDLLCIGRVNTVSVENFNGPLRAVVVVQYRLHFARIRAVRIVFQVVTGIFSVLLQVTRTRTMGRIVVT